MALISILLASALASQPAAASDDPDCGGNTSQMVACSNRIFAQAEQELDAAWRDAERRYGEQDRENNDQLSPTMLEAARAAQAAWTQYRDARCTLLANESARGGTAYPLEYIGCRTTMTRARAVELRGQPGDE